MTRPAARRRCGVLLAALTALALGAGTTPAAATTTDTTTTTSLSSLANDKGSLHSIASIIGAHAAYDAGYTGKGIDIALVDTGVTEVPGLDTGNVLHGPDLSFDSQMPELTYQDGYGHGTHMASIIAGRDAAGTPASYKRPSRFAGIAPDARLVSVKVGAHDGAVDVSQVIAAIDWVVANRNKDGLNIRVLALAYGTDGTQDPSVDPLAFAVKNARDKGIFVAVAAGNDGRGTLLLSNPATHPQITAVGVDDTQGTYDIADDVVPTWATRGTDKRHVDFVAPGVSVLGLRVPGSVVDEDYASARVSDRLFRGSGTSQAAAVTAGAAALVLQRYPTLTPDQVKRQLMTTARPLSLESSVQGGDVGEGVRYAGRGLIDVANAITEPPVNYRTKDNIGTGTGSLELARGSAHVSDGTAELVGEYDIFGNAWSGSTWSSATASGKAWSGGDWLGRTWTGDSWSGRTWTGRTWTGRTWTGRTWTSDDWAGRTWTGRTWTGDSWSGRTWTGRTWTGRTWTGGYWG